MGQKEKHISSTATICNSHSIPQLQPQNSYDSRSIPSSPLCTSSVIAKSTTPALIHNNAIPTYSELFPKDRLPSIMDHSNNYSKSGTLSRPKGGTLLSHPQGGYSSPSKMTYGEFHQQPAESPYSSLTRGPSSSNHIYAPLNSPETHHIASLQPAWTPVIGQGGNPTSLDTSLLKSGSGTPFSDGNTDSGEGDMMNEDSDRTTAGYDEFENDSPGPPNRGKRRVIERKSRMRRVEALEHLRKIVSQEKRSYSDSLSHSSRRNYQADICNDATAIIERLREENQELQRQVSTLSLQQRQLIQQLRSNNERGPPA